MCKGIKVMIKLAEREIRRSEGAELIDNTRGEGNDFQTMDKRCGL